MIEITENSMYTKKRLCKLLNKYSRGYYLFDIQAITKDLSHYQARLAQCNSFIERKELQEICNYLNVLLTTQNSQVIQATWDIHNDRLITLPICFMNHEAYDLDTISYILKREDRTISVCYKDLCDVIALQIGHRDLEFETKSIDNALLENKITLHGLSEVQILYDITVENPYNELLPLRIDQTQYRITDKDGQYFTSYFGKRLNGDTYKEALDVSISHALTIIAEQVLDQVPHSVNLEILGVIGDCIYYNTDMSNKEVMKHLAHTLLVRAFGRNFEVMPLITIC